MVIASIRRAVKTVRLHFIAFNRDRGGFRGEVEASGGITSKS